LNTSKAVDEGLNYIFTVAASVPFGFHLLGYGVKVIVSEHNSMPFKHNVYKDERHYIDIQFPLYGIEIIRCNPIEGMKTTMEYNAEKYCVLFDDIEPFCTVCKEGNGYFTDLYSNDGRELQLCIDKPEHI